MSRLSVFNFITLNGFYKGTHEDISWHVHGAEENEYAIGAMDAGNVLLFGRVTYEMMAGYWTTPEAMKEAPEVAKGMNESEKIVFSTTLKEAGWKNATLIKKNIVEEVKRLKQSSGKNMTILGSGSIVTLFAEHGLIDDYEIMIDPVALGKGTPIFNNIKHPLNLTLKATRAFKSGVVLLSYRKI
ncbi:MAG: dihydrofolate reductase family protein [Chitinophagaceae bacterium]